MISHEMLRQMTQAMGGDDDSAKGRPLPEAQAMELRTRLLDCQPTLDFRRGDLVIEKRGLGQTKPELRPTIVMMFWRYLIANDPQDMELARAHRRKVMLGADRFDCVIAYLLRSGEAVAFEPNYSAFLRLRVPGDDEPEGTP